MQQWYIAKLVFRIGSNKQVKGQFDEQVRLISATSLHDAFLKARLIGVREEDLQGDAPDTIVRWEFVDVVDLYGIDNFSDGMELCSRIHETEEGENYFHFVRSRAGVLEKRIFASVHEKTAGLVI